MVLLVLFSSSYLFCTAGVFSDIPYGIGLKQRKSNEAIPWDQHCWSLDQWAVLGRQLSATNTQPEYPFIVQCFPDQIADIKKFFEEFGYEDAHEVYWYKRTANVEGMQRHTFAVECFVVGYKGGRQKNVFNWTEMGLVNPTRRHNLIATKAVRKLVMDDETKLPVNRTQNPLALVSICGEHDSFIFLCHQNKYHSLSLNNIIKIVFRLQILHITGQLFCPITCIAR